jgi:hypothetical protein
MALNQGQLNLLRACFQSYHQNDAGIEVNGDSGSFFSTKYINVAKNTTPLANTIAVIAN